MSLKKGEIGKADWTKKNVKKGSRLKRREKTGKNKW
jgi:hypothetical protein